MLRHTVLVIQKVYKKTCGFLDFLKCDFRKNWYFVWRVKKCCVTSIELLKNTHISYVFLILLKCDAPKTLWFLRFLVVRRGGGKPRVWNRKAPVLVKSLPLRLRHCERNIQYFALSEVLGNLQGDSFGAGTSEHMWENLLFGAPRASRRVLGGSLTKTVQDRAPPEKGAKN